MTTSYFEAHDAQYQKLKTEGKAGWGGDARIAKAGELLKRYYSFEGAKQGGQLLDIGCGEGVYSRLFADKGFAVTGIDVSPTAIVWAKEKSGGMQHIKQFLQRDMSQANTELPLNNFDVAIDGQCLHCINGKDRNVFLNNVWKSLKTGGQLFVSSLCSKTDSNQHTLRDGKPYRHISTPENLITELKSQGFSILGFNVYENEAHNHVCVLTEKVDIAR